MAKVSPSKRTLDALHADGHLAQNVEKVIPHTFIKQDLYGFIDILAVRGNRVVGIQATDITNMNDRIKKAANHENLPRWLKAADFEVWGWEEVKQGKRVLYARLTVRPIIPLIPPDPTQPQLEL